MSVIFHNANGDTGTSESTSVQPIINTDPVAPAVTNRPTENLRLRTEVLKYTAAVHDLALAAPILMCSENSSGVSADIYWEGPFNPSTGSIPADVSSGGASNTGKIWLGTRGATGSYQLRLYPANSPQATRYATVSYTYPSAATLTFTTSADAGQGGNAMRVRLIGDLTSGTATAAWEGNDVLLAVQTPAASSGTPANPATGKSTLVIHVRSNGSTKVSDIQTVLAASPSPQGYTYTVTSANPSTDLVPATDTGYLRFSEGVDAVSKTISAAVLGTFFDIGRVTTTLSAPVTASGSPQQVAVASVTGISVGSVLYIDTTESVTVTAVQSSPAAITAIFSQNHSNGAAVVAAPNRLRKGDSLVALLGNPHQRIQSSGALTASDLAIVRNGQVQQDTCVIPILSVSASGTRAIFNSVHSIEAGSALRYTVQAVELAGDLLGPGSTAAVPIVKRATNTTAGVVVLNAPTQHGDGVGHVPIVKVDGTIIGTGLGTLAGTGTLTLAALAAEILDIGHASSTARVRSTTTFDLGVKLPGIDVAAAAALNVGTTTATQVNIGSSTSPVELRGAVKVYSTLDRLTAGDLAIGTTTATSVTVAKAGVSTLVKGSLKVASDVDREIAGVLTVGGTTATEVDLAKAGVVTAVKGPMTVADYTTAASTNASYPAVKGTGTGAGVGVSGVGGDSSGAGVLGTGGAPNGIGVSGTGTGSGAGVSGTGGATNAAGVAGTGGGTTGAGVAGAGAPGGNGAGVTGTGTGTAAGVSGTGGATNGAGVAGTGTGTGAGVSGTGGASNGVGVVGTGIGSGAGVSGVGGATVGSVGVLGQGGPGGGVGVKGTGSGGTSAGVYGEGSASGPGVHGVGGTFGVLGYGSGIWAGVQGVGGPSGPGMIAVAGGASSPVRGALSLQAQTTPSSPVSGDIWNDGTQLNYSLGGVTHVIADTAHTHTMASISNWSNYFGGGEYISTNGSSISLLRGGAGITGVTSSGGYSFNFFVPAGCIPTVTVSADYARLSGFGVAFVDNYTPGKWKYVASASFTPDGNNDNVVFSITYARGQ